MKIQVKMTARDIFDFSMYSAYSGFAGIFTFVFLILVIGILGYAWSSVEVMQRVMLLGCIILFVFVQPIMIWMKAKAHAKTTGYSTPINLDVSDEQIGVGQVGCVQFASEAFLGALLGLQARRRQSPGRPHDFLPAGIAEG